MPTNFQMAMKRVGGVAFTSVLLASCSQNWISSDLEPADKARKNTYESGKTQMSAGHYGLAIESFRKALSDEPQSVKVLNALAATYDLLGRYDLAERYYGQALSINPRSVQTLNNFGYSYFLRGQNGQANTLFEKAALIDDKNHVVAANLAALARARMARQVAAAAEKQERRSRLNSQPVRTTWIERSGVNTYSLLTKPDEAIVKKAHEQGVEPRIVHAPAPLIEITTAAPSLKKVAKRAFQPDPVVQPDPVKLAVMPKQGMESRVVHAPEPLIEITTAAPSLKKVARRAVRPDPVVQPDPVAQPDPVKVAVMPKQGVKSRVVHTPRALIEIKTDPSAIQTVARSQTDTSFDGLTPDRRLGSDKPGQKFGVAIARPETLETSKVSEDSGASGNTNEVKVRFDDGFRFAPMRSVISNGSDLKSYPLVAQSLESGIATGGVGVTQMEDLPKLREDIARDVKYAAANPKQTPATDSSRGVAIDSAAPSEDAALWSMTVPTLDGARDNPAKELKSGEGAGGTEANGQVADLPGSEVQVSERASLMTAMPVSAGKDDGFVKIAALTGRENSADRLDDGKDAKPALAAKAKMPDLEALKRAAGLEISNGTGRLRMAGRMSRHLLSLGVFAARLTNAESYSNKVSILHFRPGQISKAMTLSNILPLSPTLHRNAEIRTDLRLVLGGDLLKFDRQLIAKFKK